MPATTVKFSRRAALAVLGEIAEKDVKRRTRRVWNQAKREAPVDKGQLRASVFHEVGRTRRAVVGRVGSKLAHALYTHEGTGRYGPKRRDIRTRKVMRFPKVNNSGSGRRRYKRGATAKYVFTRRSRGQKPNPWLVRALDAAE